MPNSEERELVEVTSYQRMGLGKEEWDDEV